MAPRGTFEAGEENRTRLDVPSGIIDLGGARLIPERPNLRTGCPAVTKRTHCGGVMEIEDPNTWRACDQETENIIPSDLRTGQDGEFIGLDAAVTRIMERCECPLETAEKKLRRAFMSGDLNSRLCKDGFGRATARDGVITADDWFYGRFSVEHYRENERIGPPYFVEVSVREGHALNYYRLSVVAIYADAFKYWLDSEAAKASAAAGQAFVGTASGRSAGVWTNVGMLPPNTTFPHQAVTETHKPENAAPNAKATLLPKKRRGPSDAKRKAAVDRMREDIRSGRTSLQVLQQMKQVALASEYGLKSRDTARKALAEAAQFVGVSNTDK